MRGILWAVIETPPDITRLYPQGSPNHVTLRYGVCRWLWRWVEGKRFTATTQFVASNERVQAIAVTLPWWTRIICEKPIPHITVSYVESAKPVEANTMLRSPTQQESFSSEISCVIQFSPFRK